jgi:exosortase D (VPLPA-CTERM-specific)
MLAPRQTLQRSSPTLFGLLLGTAVLIALVGFGTGLSEVVGRWIQQDEYSHGFLIPLISAWLLWSRRDVLVASIGPPAWTGPAVIVLSILMQVVGELSALYILSQVGFVVALLGIVLSTGGYSLLKVTLTPILFLLFSMPLPYFIEAVLTWRLQLISSELGVAVIRLFQIPVYLEGNVIDLGYYKLQVVEACSGLRYLYPLLSLSFLAAYFFHAPFWQRAVVFLSAMPITILMNSLRIGLVGVLVNRWGTQAAEGLLHFFEGWTIFIASAGLLIGEIILFARFGSGKSFFEIFALPVVTAPRLTYPSGQSKALMMVSLALLCLGGAATYLLSNRQEIVPERQRFVGFPNGLGPWQGRPSLLEPQVEHALGLEDYILADYTSPGSGSVNLYIAYYASQRKGVSPHSPIVCMPGGGWQITRFERTAYTTNALSLPFNRAIIERNSTNQLVYYWFVQRGRTISNEYASKWYLLTDAILENRTDGALVRLTTPIYPGEVEQSADHRLQSFIQELQPRLAGYLPGRLASAH